MRHIWLVPAALFLTTGMGWAQTTGSTPAPQGSNQAPVETPVTGAAGKTAPHSADTSTPMTQVPATPGQNMGGGQTTSTPAPDGAVNAPVETPQTGAAGKTAPASGGTAQ
jgi:hypothetical protein